MTTYALGMATRSAAPGDAETPSAPPGEGGAEGDSEEAAKEWADREAEKIGGIFLLSHPTGKDW